MTAALNDGITEPKFPRSPGETRAFIESFPFWYHRIYLGGGIYTIGGRGHHEEVWDRFAKAAPASFNGASFLDIGTNAGYFALQAKLRGAGRVIGIESEEIYLRQAEEIRKIWGLDIEYQRRDAHDVASFKGTFDVVIFAGILYHLKNPLQVLEDIGKICNDSILVESEIIPDDPRNCVIVRQGVPAELRPMSSGIMKFIETTDLNNDPTNWWVPDTECVKGMLRTAGFNYFSQPVILHGCRLCLLASKRRDSMFRLDAFR